MGLVEGTKIEIFLVSVMCPVFHIFLSTIFQFPMLLFFSFGPYLSCWSDWSLGVFCLGLAHSVFFLFSSFFFVFVFSNNNSNN